MGESIPADVVERVNGLHRQLNEASYRYYVLDDPTLPDAEYDRLFRELQTLEARFPSLISQESPTQRVGSEPAAAFTEASHRQPMLSWIMRFQTPNWRRLTSVCESASSGMGHCSLWPSRS